MDIEELIKNNLGDFRIKGKEAIIKTCPFCGRNKDKFYLNLETGLYKCFSGSCGESGSIEKLMNHLGLEGEVKKTNKSGPAKKEVLNFKKDDYKTLGVLSENKINSKEQSDFLEQRGISWQVGAELDVWVRKQDGWLTFIYRNQVQVLAVKYRDYRDKEFRFSKKDGTDPLFNSHRILGEQVIICEGEMDVLACAEVGFKDIAASVPNGASSLGWIEYNWEFLESKKEIILAFDSDTAGQKALSEVLKRLDITKCKTLNMKGEKDLNDILVNQGKIELLNTLNNPIDVEIEGLKDIADQKCDIGDTEKISFELELIDQLFGGCRFGELTIVSGQPGAGKSTILNQIVCDFVNTGHKVFYYSGEFPKAKLKRWLYIVLGGMDSLTTIYDKHKKRDSYILKQGIEEKIDNWIRNKLFLYDAGTDAKQNELLTIMKYGYKKQGIRLFVLDNLMTIGLDEINDDKYENQKNFLTELHEFAINYNVHVFLVAHPKKTEGKKISDLSFYDIAGSSNIPNLADNILFLKRLSKTEIQDTKEKLGYNFSTAAVLLKDREYGEIGSFKLLSFQNVTRRFYNPENQIDIRKKYKWLGEVAKKENGIEELKEIEELLGV